MSDHRIARAKPRPDYTVEIEWSDGTRSVADFRRFIDRGGAFAELKEPVLFLHNLYVQWEGESLAWEVFGQVVDFHADNLWRDSHRDREAAE